MHNGSFVDSVVLVVDDDPVVLQVIQKTLESCGCKVITAADGEEALVKIRGFDGLIDVLLSDFQMPRLNGLELIGRVRTERPGTATLLMSGSPAPFCPTQPLLRKPFGPAQLTEAVRRLLEPTH